MLVNIVLYKMFSLKFPREICNPSRKLVKTKKEFIKKINSAIHHSNIYTNVYNFIEFDKYRPIYNSAIIDRIFFDFDPKIDTEPRPQKGYYDFINVFNYCLKNKWKCYPYLSGSGYHLYVKVKCKEVIRDKKFIIYNAQIDVIDNVNKKLGKGKEVMVDYRTMKKTDQIARLPYTYNFKCRRYCIPLFKDIVFLGDKKIKEIASNKNKVMKLRKRKFNGFGNKVWDITHLNTGFYKIKDDVKLPNDVSNINVEGVKGRVPKCIKYLLSQTKLSWSLRAIEIIWLRDNAYLLSETLNILKEHLTEKRKHGRKYETDYEHCISLADGNQPNAIYKREDLLFPTHETMRMKGLCPYKNYKKCNERDTGCMLYRREKKYGR